MAKSCPIRICCHSLEFARVRFAPDFAKPLAKKAKAHTAIFRHPNLSHLSSGWAVDALGEMCESAAEVITSASCCWLNASIVMTRGDPPDAICVVPPALASGPE